MSNRTLLLGFIMTVVTLLWSCQAAPIKVALTTVAIPDDVHYMASGKGFQLTKENPTQTITIGGIECVMRAETPAEISEGKAGSKLFFKTPTQEFTFGINRDQPVELTLDNGRKYFLRGQGYSYFADAEKKEIASIGILSVAGIQTGQFKQIPIVLYDLNMDGFYDSKDGIIVGPPMGADAGGTKLCQVQPLSKYISTPAGIFEIQNTAKDGSEITLVPYRGLTATLEIVAPKNHSGQIILTSDDAKMNVAVSGKAGESVTVIPGSYTFYASMLSPPQKSGWITVMRDGMSALKVEAGAKRVLVLSGPKTLEFQAKLSDGKVNISLDRGSFKLKGQDGESYSPDYDSENPPEVYLNVDGKSTLLGKMEFG